MVHLTETQGWQRGMQAARERSRWDLADEDVERHLGLSLDFMMELMGEPDPSARKLDPSGERPLKVAKEMRRQALREWGRRSRDQLSAVAHEHYGLPDSPLRYWPRLENRLPWRAPVGALPAPDKLVS
jgi:hypothetical protein